MTCEFNATKFHFWLKEEEEREQGYYSFDFKHNKFSEIQILQNVVDHEQLLKPVILQTICIMELADDDGIPTGLCCVCGVSMPANKVNTCALCLQGEHDVTADFSKSGVLNRCKGCERYAKDTTGWIKCEAESKTLLALCLKKIKGLQKVSLVDACFIWTEAHSKRIKVKLVVQKEVTNEVVLQQSCVVEFVIQGRMCEDCHLEEANMGSYNSIVQVRQKVDHKRTFLFLEQLILKHGQDKRTVKIEPQPHGIDFFFCAKNDAMHFIDFLDTVVCHRYRTSKKIISQDIHCNTATWNFTYAVEIVPLCKDDLVCLPRTTAQRLGCISQIVVCIQTSNLLRFIDPVSCQVCDMIGEKYWPRPFMALQSSPRLIPFVVIDIQLEDMDFREKPGSSLANVKPGKRKGKSENSFLNSKGNNLSKGHLLASVTVARDSDLGVNDTKFTVLSHLGHLLKPGDSVLGYDITNMNLNDTYLDDLKSGVELPDVVLIRKQFPKYRKKNAKRNWKLKSLVEFGDTAGFGMVQNEKKDTLEFDREQFMRDLEEDEELRSKINMYKSSAQQGNDESDDSDVEDDAPVVALETLLDDLQLTKAVDEDIANESDDEL